MPSPGTEYEDGEGDRTAAAAVTTTTTVTIELITFWCAAMFVYVMPHCPNLVIGYSVTAFTHCLHNRESNVDDSVGDKFDSGRCFFTICRSFQIICWFKSQSSSENYLLCSE